MNIPVSKKNLFTIPALGTILLFSANIAPLAAQSGNSARPAVTIDGALEPERIPDWMLWRELFNGVLLLADKAPNAGRGFWQSRFVFSEIQIAHLIAHARAYRNAEKASEDEIKRLAQKKGIERGATQSQIHHVKADRESRTLEFRDALKAKIGAHAYEKLNSYIRINLAPNIKVIKTEDHGK